MADTKQHTAEFEKCVTQVIEQGHEKSSAFAICTDSFQKAAKPIFVGEAETQKLHLFCESIQLEGNKVSGVAIHPRRIFHPSEDMTHVYLKKELKKAAPSLAGKPFGIDHAYILPPPNLVTEAWYDEKQNGVAFRGLVDDHIAEKIREKAFKGISIELDWLRPGGSVEYVNGVAAKNFELTSLHLLKQFPPGDPDAFCKLIEAAEKKLARMKEQLVVAPAKTLDEQVAELKRIFTDFQNAVNERLARIEGALGQVTVTGVMKMKEQNQNQKPEKDEHGCVIGKEKWNPETEKCVLIEQPPATKESLKKLREQAIRYGVTRVEDCILDGLEGGLSNADIANNCGTDPSVVELLKTQYGYLAKKLAEMKARFKEQPEVDQCVLDGVALGLGNEEIAEKCDVTLITVQEIRGGFTGLYEALKKLREQQGNQEPEKDEHGCVIGKEKWDAETEKCVPIETVKEQQGETDEQKQFMAQCLTSGKSMEECAAEWKQKQAAQTESIVTLRKKLVEVEATLSKMEKQQKRKAATWKEKYMQFYNAVKGKLPESRNWKSWTGGPQMYVQEMLKILREHAPDENSKSQFKVP